MSLLEVGHVVRPHGLRGEVVVSLVTNRTERIAAGSRLDTKRTSGASGPLLEVRASRPFQDRHLVTFVGIESREDADALRGLALLAEPEESEGELYVHELIGRMVLDQSGTERGRVLSVQANPASDLLVLDNGALVPLRFVTSADGDQIAVEVPEGLFD